MKYSIKDLVWIYSKREHKLYVYVYNEDNTRIKDLATDQITYLKGVGLTSLNEAAEIVEDSECLLYQGYDLFNRYGSEGFPILKKEYEFYQRECPDTGDAEEYVSSRAYFSTGEILRCRALCEKILNSTYVNKNKDKYSSGRRF